ncbi:MAG: carbohydrate porin [Verrucomicrobiota bacterium]
MSPVFFPLTGIFLLGSAVVAVAQNDTADLRKELDALRGDYERRINQLESRIRELESTPSASGAEAPVRVAKPDDGSVDMGPGPLAKDEELAAAKKREADARIRQQALRDALQQRFSQDTETRDFSGKTDPPDLMAKRMEDMLQGYVDITGYFRAGYGRADQGGAQQAFGIPGVSKYRLGNEAENYGELAFAKTFFPAGFFQAGGETNPNDPIARMTYRMSYYNPYSSYGTGAATDFASPEAWASLTNVVPGFADAKIWAGNRFYRRHDIHINDFYFWDMSGGGAGIEDLTLGNGQLSFAWIGSGDESAIYNSTGLPDPLNQAGFSKTSYDLRYYDWPFFGGIGEVGLIYSRADSGVDASGLKGPDSQGVSINLVRSDTGFLDKESLHKLSVQFGTGPAKTFTSGFETFTDSAGTYIRPDPDDSWRFRVTDQIVVKPIEEFAIGSAFVYQHTDFGEDIPNQDWLSGGLRPIWFFTDSLNVAMEFGVDWVSETAVGPGGTLGKITLAPEVALGDQFFSRPVLRAFVTYSLWSDGLEGEIAGPEYANQTSGWSWGIQMEAWW